MGGGSEKDEPAGSGSSSNALSDQSNSMSNLSISGASTGQTVGPAWPNKKENYDLQDAIGVGATATVYRAMCKPRGELCAIKCINLEKCQTSVDELSHEIQAMSLCAHPNVVNYYTSFVVGEELWVVMRLLSCGSMLDILKRKIKAMGKENASYGVLDEITIATVLKEVLKGLDYFHSSGQIHRDIKAGNILLASDGTVQVADFGVSGWLAANGGDLSRQKLRHTFVGTPAGWHLKSWSKCPVTISRLIFGHSVLMLTLQNDPPNLDTNAERKDQYKAYGKSFRQVIKDCLQKDPAKQFGIRSMVSSVSIPKKVASGKLKKDKDGNWEFEYDDPETDDSGESPENSTIQNSNSNRPGIIGAPETEDTASGSVLNLVLRVRNNQRELNDIKFDYSDSDTVDGIAHELVTAELIDGHDLVVVAANLKKLIDLAKSNSDKNLSPLP
uniref:non-specific serine/threonine protein kinase n=1 Tax=Ditylenchus dipsaci TaxID=166011 RepID=A0A915EL50_9BILA